MTRQDNLEAAYLKVISEDVQTQAAPAPAPATAPTAAPAAAPQQPAQQGGMDANTQKQIQDLLTKLVDKVTQNPDDEALVNILTQLSQTTDAQQQLQILQSAKQLQEHYDMLNDIINEGLMDTVKSVGRAVKAGTQAFKQNVQGKSGGNVFQQAKQTFNNSQQNMPSENAQKKIEKFKNNIGRYLAELNRDLTDLKFDATKYPEVNKALTDLTASLQQGGIDAVDTKMDKFTHGVGKFVGGAVTNAAIFGGLNMALGGMNPYVAKGISGAAASVLRDIRKGNTKDKAGMLKRALLGAGIGVTIQGAGDLISGMSGGAEGAASGASQAAMASGVDQQFKDSLTQNIQNSIGNQDFTAVGNTVQGFSAANALNSLPNKDELIRALSVTDSSRSMEAARSKLQMLLTQVASKQMTPDQMTEFIVKTAGNKLANAQ